MNISNKLDKIIENYLNGNKREAAKAIRSLSKLALAELLINDHRLPNNFIGNHQGRLQFQDFILRTLMGWDF